MKLVWLVLISSALSGTLAHAKVAVTCRGDGTELNYSSDDTTFSFTAKNISPVGPLLITGEVLSKPALGRNELFTVFSYPLSGGYNVDILWESSGEETIRPGQGSVRPVPVQATASKNGSVIASYSQCQWVE